VSDPGHGPLPRGREHPGIDLAQLWAKDADANIELVNVLLTQLRRHSQADHDTLLPYVQRSPAVANRVLAIAKRLAGAW